MRSLGEACAASCRRPGAPTAPVRAGQRTAIHRAPHTSTGHVAAIMTSDSPTAALPARGTAGRWWNVGLRRFVRGIQLAFTLKARRTRQ